MLGGHRFNDDKPGGHGYVDMYSSIVVSCDTYYYQLGNEMGIDAIHDFMKPFGFGQLTGIDLEHEKIGILPSQEWKRERFKKNRAAQKWVGGDTISISIGQGFNSYTPLQLAHAMSTLANNGVVMKPHLVKILEDGGTRARTLTVAKESGRIPLKQENIDVIKRAMVGVTTDQSGTGYTRVPQRRLHGRRQDRHRAGGRPARRQIQRRGDATSGCATTRCSPPSRRPTSRASRSPWWSKTPASAPPSPRRSCARRSTTTCWASGPGDKTKLPRCRRKTPTCCRSKRRPASATEFKPGGETPGNKE